MLQWTKNRHAAGVAVLVAITLLLSGFLLFYHLGTESFQDYDEATYAEITAESLASHQYLSLTFLDHTYFRKPPLLFWINDVSKSFIARPEVADRLSSAISAFILIGLLMFILYEVTGSGIAAVCAGIVLATTSAFIEPSRQVRFDILVSLFDVLSLYTFWKALSKDRRWFLAFGAMVGLAILSKGPLIIYAVAAGFALAGIYKKFAWLRDAYFWGGMLITLLIIVPWHAWETIHFGAAFWQTYLGDQVINRVGEMLFTDQPTNLGYLGYTFTFAAPWTEVFCILVVCMIPLTKQLPLQIRAWFWASVAGVASVLSVDFITKTKAFSYLIPLYPFMALTIGLGMYGITQRLSALERFVISVVFAGCAICGCAWSVFNGFHIDPYHAAEMNLAVEEKHIGVVLKSDGADTFYVYDNVTTLGAIMFYSHDVTPQFIQSARQIPNGSYILYPVGTLVQLRAAYPAQVVSSVYEGHSLGIAEVTK